MRRWPAATITHCPSSAATARAIGEAFQLRDDVLGVFGSTSATGKPSGGDLIERKATSLVMAAHQLADAPTRRELAELMHSDELDDDAVQRWRALIVETGAVERIEQMITDRVASARNELSDMPIDESVRAALAEHGRGLHGARAMTQLIPVTCA